MHNWEKNSSGIKGNFDQIKREEGGQLKKNTPKKPKRNPMKYTEQIGFLISPNWEKKDVSFSSDNWTSFLSHP